MIISRSQRTGTVISIIIVFLFSLLLAYIGYWYLIILPSAITGLLAIRLRRIAISAIASPAGVVVAMSPHISYGVAQSSLFSTIAGIPEGPALPLIILLVMSYLFALLPMAAASSFVSEKTQ